MSAVNLFELVQNPATAIAIVGATEDQSKYGNIIYRDLKRKGFVLFPVNPKRKFVEGDRVYPSLRELPQKPGLVNFVVPPEQTLRVLKECLALEFVNVWIQPGAEDDQVRAFLARTALNYIVDDCIMVRSATLAA